MTTISFYSMNGCSFCKKAEKLLADQIKSGQIVKKTTQDAKADGLTVSGFPAFVISGETSNVHTGCPKSYSDLLQKLGMAENFKQPAIIIVYIEDWCGYCTKMKKTLSNEIELGLIEVRQASTAKDHGHVKETSTGVPAFVCPKTGATTAGAPVSYDALKKSLGITTENYNPYQYNAMPMRVGVDECSGCTPPFSIHLPSGKLIPPSGMTQKDCIKARNRKECKDCNPGSNPCAPPPKPGPLGPDSKVAAGKCQSKNKDGNPNNGVDQCCALKCNYNPTCTADCVQIVEGHSGPGPGGGSSDGCSTKSCSNSECCAEGCTEDTRRCPKGCTYNGEGASCTFESGKTCDSYDKSQCAGQIILDGQQCVCGGSGQGVPRKQKAQRIQAFGANLSTCCNNSKGGGDLCSEFNCPVGGGPSPGPIPGGPIPCVISNTDACAKQPTTYCSVNKTCVSIPDHWTQDFYNSFQAGMPGISKCEINGIGSIHSNPIDIETTDLATDFTNVQKNCAKNPNYYRSPVGSTPGPQPGPQPKPPGPLKFPCKSPKKRCDDGTCSTKCPTKGLSKLEITLIVVAIVASIGLTALVVYRYRRK